MSSQQWACSCGKHTGIQRLRDVRRSSGAEYHGIFWCGTGDRSITPSDQARHLGRPLGEFRDGNGQAWSAIDAARCKA